LGREEAPDGVRKSCFTCMGWTLQQLRRGTGGRGCIRKSGPKAGIGVSMRGVGEKNDSFFSRTLPKLQFPWSFHLFGHHATWHVGPTWGLRRAWIGWEKFSIVFAHYSIDLSVKRSHHVRREGLEIPTLIQKEEEITLLDFMKIWRSRLIQRIHKLGNKIWKSKESVFNTNTINKYINLKLKIRKLLVNVYRDWERKKC
jgi:hypothetical protein